MLDKGSWVVQFTDGDPDNGVSPTYLFMNNGRIAEARLAEITAPGLPVSYSLTLTSDEAREAGLVGDGPYTPKLTGEQLVELLRAYLLKLHTDALKSLEAKPLIEHIALPSAEGAAAELDELQETMRLEQIEFETKLIEQIKAADLKGLLDEMRDFTEANYASNDLFAVVYAALTGSEMPSVD